MYLLCHSQTTGSILWEIGIEDEDFSVFTSIHGYVEHYKYRSAKIKYVIYK